MFGVTDLWIFIFSGFLLNIIPGPDSLYIAGRSASYGVTAGMIAALGVASGMFVHILAAAFGFSAIISTSAQVFWCVKMLGCLYLLYMGVSLIFKKGQPSTEIPHHKIEATYFQIYYQGFLTNALNPKVAFFFLAFVPQFISVDFPNKTMSFIFLGLIFNMNSLLFTFSLAWCAASIRKKISKNSYLIKWFRRLAGSLFIYFGIKLVMSEQN